jgi:hypothetical protein
LYLVIALVGLKTVLVPICSTNQLYPLLSVSSDENNSTSHDNNMQLPEEAYDDPGEEFIDKNEMLESVDNEYTLSENGTLCRWPHRAGTLGGMQSNPRFSCWVYYKQVGNNDKD